ncbi:hypothetical protein L6164_008982 [Bauhinia variegata]|uniref:Uncharacterized protein n=1 Tax=Bauhinia variegata TaxID=167791 RepID=A0ACB9PHJ9_BAUVA|nr:hypothetical protein L6164_008982 [Bauhinia variegata]
MDINKLYAMLQQKMTMPTTSDDSALVKNIVSEHKPEQAVEYNVKPLIRLVEEILKHSTLSSRGVSMDGLAKDDNDEDKMTYSGYHNVPEELSVRIDKISSELSHKALCGVDSHSTTVSIFKMVTNYKWDLKLVLALAAVAQTYGKFCLLAHIHATNQLAKSMAILKQLPGIMEHADSLKPRFDALNNLVQVILDVTKGVIRFNDLPHSYFTQDVAAYSTASYLIPIASYWSVRGIVACATQVTSLTILGYESVGSTIEDWELSAFAHKLKNILDHLKQQLDSCYKDIENKKDDEAYGLLVQLFKMTHNDNMNILRALIYARDDVLPLIDGFTKRKVSLEVLRSKNVLLLISGLDISIDEEWNDSMQMQFERLQITLPWYSVSHPSLIAKAVNWFVQREWEYKNKPILVVLDPQGSVACRNAMHMMWIWGFSAFPFTSAREEALWREETWRLELLVDGIDDKILNWIKEGKYIFLYGGVDVEWVRKFVKEARRVGVAAGIPLEMVYVGKSNNWDKAGQVLDYIVQEKLPTHCWQDKTTNWFFWTRLESMLFSKIQLQRADDHDVLMQKIKKFLSFDNHPHEWFLLANGSNIVVNGEADMGLRTLIEYDTEWKEQADKRGYGPAFEQHYKKLHAEANPYCRFEYSPAEGKIPDKRKCPECQRQMRILTTFQCSHDEKLHDNSKFVTVVAPLTEK